MARKWAGKCFDREWVLFKWRVNTVCLLAKSSIDFMADRISFGFHFYIIPHRKHQVKPQ